MKSKSGQDKLKNQGNLRKRQKSPESSIKDEAKQVLWRFRESENTEVIVEDAEWVGGDIRIDVKLGDKVLYSEGAISDDIDNDNLFLSDEFKDFVTNNIESNRKYKFLGVGEEYTLKNIGLVRLIKKLREEKLKQAYLTESKREQEITDFINKITSSMVENEKEKDEKVTKMRDGLDEKIRKEQEEERKEEEKKAEGRRQKAELERQEQEENKKQQQEAEKRERKEAAKLEEEKQEAAKMNNDQRVKRKKSSESSSDSEEEKKVAPKKIMKSSKKVKRKLSSESSSDSEEEKKEAPKKVSEKLQMHSKYEVVEPQGNIDQAKELHRLVKEKDEGVKGYYKDSNFNFDSYRKLGQDERVEVQADSGLIVKKEKSGVTVNAQSTTDIQGFADDNKFSAYHGKQVGLLKQKGFHAWKVVRGDGNCYYRSVMIQYLEKIFTYDDQSDRINLLINDYEKFVADQSKPGALGKKSFMSAADFKKAMEELNKSQKEEKLQKIHDKIAYKDDFDISLIGWLRYKIAKKIEKDSNLKINGLSIEFAISMPKEQYISNVVAKMDEDAQDVMFAITPLILNAKIDTVFVDVKNKVNDVTFQECRPLKGFSISSQGGGEVKTEGKVDGSLGKNTLHLFPFLKGGHYDIIYQDQDLIHWQREGVKLPSHMGSGLFDENNKELTPNDKYSKSTNINYSNSASVWKETYSILQKAKEEQADAEYLKENLYKLNVKQIKTIGEVLNGERGFGSLGKESVLNDSGRQHVWDMLKKSIGDAIKNASGETKKELTKMQVQYKLHDVGAAKLLFDSYFLNKSDGELSKVMMREIFYDNDGINKYTEVLKELAYAEPRYIVEVLNNIANNSYSSHEKLEQKGILRHWIEETNNNIFMKKNNEIFQYYNNNKKVDKFLNDYQGGNHGGAQSEPMQMVSGESDYYNQINNAYPVNDLYVSNIGTWLVSGSGRDKIIQHLKQLFKIGNVQFIKDLLNLMNNKVAGQFSQSQYEKMKENGIIQAWVRDVQGNQEKKQVLFKLLNANKINDEEVVNGLYGSAEQKEEEEKQQPGSVSSEDSKVDLKILAEKAVNIFKKPQYSQEEEDQLLSIKIQLRELGKEAKEEFYKEINDFISVMSHDNKKNAIKFLKEIDSEDNLLSMTNLKGMAESALNSLRSSMPSMPSMTGWFKGDEKEGEGMMEGELKEQVSMLKSQYENTDVEVHEELYDVSNAKEIIVTANKRVTLAIVKMKNEEDKTGHLVFIEVVKTMSGTKVNVIDSLGCNSTYAKQMQELEAKFNEIADVEVQFLDNNHGECAAQTLIQVSESISRAEEEKADSLIVIGERIEAANTPYESIGEHIIRENVIREALQRIEERNREQKFQEDKQKLFEAAKSRDCETVERIFGEYDKSYWHELQTPRHGDRGIVDLVTREELRENLFYCKLEAILSESQQNEIALSMEQRLYISSLNDAKKLLESPVIINEGVNSHAGVDCALSSPFDLEQIELSNSNLANQFISM